MTLVAEHRAALQAAVAASCENLAQVILHQSRNGRLGPPWSAYEVAPKPMAAPLAQVFGREESTQTPLTLAEKKVATPAVLLHPPPAEPSEAELVAAVKAAPVAPDLRLPSEGISSRGVSGKDPPRKRKSTGNRSSLDQPPTLPEKEESHTVARGANGNPAGGIFADADGMKQKLRDAMAQPQYDVANFYWTTGYCQAVARSTMFENLTLTVIAVNALWISIDVDLNQATMLVDADPGFQVVDNLFCAYFVFEWAVRFGAFEVKANGLKDAWFVFDSVLCALMAGETWVLSLVMLMFGAASGGMGDASLLKAFKLVRLVRMARVIRLLNALPELMVVIKGMAVATRAVSCTVLLMLLIIYVFAVAFRQLSDDSAFGDKHWPNVPTTMRYLLLQGTAPDLYHPAVEIWDENVFYALLFLFYILVVSITVMNMLVGVLVGVVNTVAAVEKEQLMVNFVQTNLCSLLENQKIDRDNSGTISRDEFEDLIQLPEAMRSLTQMGVDVVGLVDLADFIFQDYHYKDREIPFADFMELIMQLRGSNQATVKDIVDLRKFITQEINKNHMGSSIPHIHSHPQLGQAALATPLHSPQGSILNGYIAPAPAVLDLAEAAERGAARPVQQATLPAAPAERTSIASIMSPEVAHPQVVGKVETTEPMRPRSDEKPLTDDLEQLSQDSLTKKKKVYKKGNASRAKTAPAIAELVEPENGTNVLLFGFPPAEAGSARTTTPDDAVLGEEVVSGAASAAGDSIS